MQCNCCKAPVQSNEALCPVCGLPLLVESTTPEGAEVIRQHRAKKLSPIQIMLRQSCYDILPEQIAEEPACNVDLMNALSLSYGEIVWSELTFESVKSDRSFDIEISIANGGSTASHSLHFQPDTAIDHTNIGFILEDGFSVSVVVGTKEQYIRSTESIALL